jgi:thioredoxin reductase (NADPH)
MTTQPLPVAETPDPVGAFPRLSDEQLAALMPHGEVRAVDRGDVLYREGERSNAFLVVLSGAVALVSGYGADEQVVGVHGRGRFLGGLGLLTGEAMFLTAVVTAPGQVLSIPIQTLRELVDQDPALGDLVLRAFLLRRSLLIKLGAGLRIIGSRFSPDTRRLREFAARNRLPHTWIDLEEDRGAEDLLRHLGVQPEETPVVVWGARHVLRNPSTAELATLIGLPVPAAADSPADLVVVGAGPAGLAAAVYGASEGLTTMALDAVATGGQAGTSSKIENYLGFPAGVSGGELAERALVQAEKFGAQFGVPGSAVGLGMRDGHFVVRLEDGGSVPARSVVICTGVHYRRLPVPRLDEFEGKSVFYAATEVEAQMCTGHSVAVVGGGNSAGQAALFLARKVGRVSLLVRDEDLGKSMSRYLINRIGQNPAIEVLTSTEVSELVGDDAELRGLVLHDRRTSEQRRLDARALFVFIGADPHVDWLAGQVALDDHGFILTGASAAANGAVPAAREPAPLETSLPGVFAAGDVRSGSIKRVASAVGEGAMAVRLVHDHLAGVRELEHPAVSQR